MAGRERQRRCRPWQHGGERRFLIVGEIQSHLHMFECEYAMCGYMGNGNLEGLVM